MLATSKCPNAAFTIERESVVGACRNVHDPLVCERGYGLGGALPRADPSAYQHQLAPGGKMRWRPPATADAHRADISSLRDSPWRHQGLPASAPNGTIAGPMTPAWSTGGARTWSGAGAAVDASSSVSPASRPRTVMEPVHGLTFVGGRSPSNRSEAVVLSHGFEEMLSAPPTSLFGVSVKKLKAAMQDGTAPEAAMEELWTGHTYLEPVTNPDGSKRGSLAIISYRVIPADDGALLASVFTGR